MHTRSVRTRVSLALGCLTALVAAVPFWPYETGALMGTSETYVDIHADGAYFDPSIGRRVVASR